MKKLKLPDTLIEQFDKKKNTILINDLHKWDTRKVWWICDKKHSWLVSVRNRFQKTKEGKVRYSQCPTCYLKIKGQFNRKELPKILIDQFDKIKNKGISLIDFPRTSKKKIWWICSRKHSWSTSLRGRYSYKNKNGLTSCPKCKVLEKIKTHPNVLKFFNQRLNPNVDLNLLPHRSKKLITWQCDKNKKHIWKTKYISRAGGSEGCPYCTGVLIEEHLKLKNLFPNIFNSIIKENKEIDYDNLAPGSKKIFNFKCPKGKDHIFKRSLEGITRYHQLNKQEIKKYDKNFYCPFCDNKKLSITNNLKKTHPKLSKMFDEKKNKKKVDKILFSTHDKWWWNCKKGHQFYAATGNVQRSINTRYQGCSVCSGKTYDDSVSLRIKEPKLYAEVDKKLNKNIDIKKLKTNSSKSIYWRCKKNKKHIWQYPVNQRVRYPKCPYCNNRKFHPTESLESKYPSHSKYFDISINNGLKPSEVKANSFSVKYKWRCIKDPSHVWENYPGIVIKQSEPCPLCSDNFKWNKTTLKSFLISIKDHIKNLSPAEKFLIFQQTGMPAYRSSTRNFIKNFATGKFPVEEIEKFINNQKSLVDEFIENQNLNLENQIDNKISINDDRLFLDFNKNNITNLENKNLDSSDNDLPYVKTKDVLKTFLYLVRNVNQEAIEFLIASAKHKIWRDVFRNEKQAIIDLKKYNKDEYVKRVQFEFLNEYKRAKALKLPKGYSFEHKPNLMQKLTAAKVIQDRRVGNWSGTGAGKTLSAVLASRYIGAKNVVVCCPNALAQRMDAGWAHEIISIFPDSNVRLKSFDPLLTKTNNFYVLNFEAFQQKDSSKKIVEFLKNVKVDFVIVDEIHYSKQRQVDNLSLRKKNITSMLAEIQKKNKKLHVLGMSATPVINNLYEGRSLVEMITGEVHKDLPTQININNCMKLHQKLATVGLRWMPDYKMNLKTTIEDIDCSHITDDVKELGKHPTPLDLEKLLTREKMQIIKKHIEPKTMIYTHYLDDIADYIKEELEKDGLRVGMFTGEDKSGLEEFKNGSLDVLIGSKTVGTGVNGLQNVCRKIIINSLPWTNAEYEQLIGRVYRQGQKRDVEIVIPLTEGTVNGQQWSWCKSRYDRIKFKKTVGDAAVDGVIPSEEIRTESQVLQDLMKWIERISGDDDFEIKREPIKSEFVFDSSDEQKRIAKYGDFSKMNREWNNSRSITTHEKIKKNPDLWKHYHQMFEENKKKWTVVPTTELVRFFKSREGYEIGDFGCGKAILHEQLSDKHTIHSFDHYACNQYVTACDISKTALNDKQLDFAIFSLSMMGSNIADYIIEANRTLKLDGGLFIIEATSRFKDLDQFKRQLIQFGFDYLSVKEMGKFTQIKADKVKDIDLKNNLELKF